MGLPSPSAKSYNFNTPATAATINPTIAPVAPTKNKKNDANNNGNNNGGINHSHDSFNDNGNSNKKETESSSSSDGGDNNFPFPDKSDTDNENYNNKDKISDNENDNEVVKDLQYVREFIGVFIILFFVAITFLGIYIRQVFFTNSSSNTSSVSGRPYKYTPLNDSTECTGSDGNNNRYYGSLGVEIMDKSEKSATEYPPHSMNPVSFFFGSKKSTTDDGSGVSNGGSGNGKYGMVHEEIETKYVNF